jgi:hypothetical protein
MLANLNPNKTTGNDNIPAKILKISSNCISQSLSCIVNSSLETGVFPNRWKIAKMSSILKGNIATIEIITDRYQFYPAYPRYVNRACVNNQMNEHDQEFQTFFEPMQSVRVQKT